MHMNELERLTSFIGEIDALCAKYRLSIKRDYGEMFISDNYPHTIFVWDAYINKKYFSDIKGNNTWEEVK